MQSPPECLREPITIPVFRLFVFHFRCTFDEEGPPAHPKPSMNPLRTIILILAALMQVFPAQAVRSLSMVSMERAAVCGMACCAELAAEGLDACGCSTGGESPAAEVASLPPVMRESAQLGAALAAGGRVLGWRPEKRVEEARPAGLVCWKPHLPKVRLSVLFCSFLN
jgi:hypothetical protein